MSRTLPLLAALVLAAPPASASDHADNEITGLDASADLTGLYAWMSDDGRDVNLVMGVRGPFAPTLQYVFHLSGARSRAGAEGALQIACTFPAGAEYGQCWLYEPGPNPGVYAAYVRSDDVASSPGVTLRTGRFDDPFFLDLEGFREVRLALTLAPDRDPLGCPVLTSTRAAQLAATLSAEAGDDFAGESVYGIVLSLDAELLTGQLGPELRVWAATYEDVP